MTTVKRVALALLIVGAVAAQAARAADDPTDQSKLIKPVDKTLTFIFIPKLIHPWYDTVRQGAEYAVEEFKKQGIDIVVRFDPPPVADLNEHIKKIESAISARPDGIAVAALDPAANAQVIDDGIAAGATIFTFDTDSPMSKRPCYVGHNRDEADGEMLAHFLAGRIGGKGNIGILTGSLTAPNHVGRTTGFRRAIAEYPDIKIVFERSENDDLQKAEELTENALQAHPDLVGFFACNPSNIGIGRAVRNAGLAGKIHIVGMDLLDETMELMQEGVLDGVVTQRQWEAGYWTVVYLVRKYQGHTFPAEHQTGSRLFTADDL